MYQEYESETANEQPFAGESESAGEMWRRRRRRRIRSGMRPRFFRRRRRRIFANPNFGSGGFGGGAFPEPPEPPESDDDAGESEFRGRVVPGRFAPRSAFRSVAFRRPLVRRFGPMGRPRVGFRSGIRPRIMGRHAFRPGIRAGVWRGRHPLRPLVRPGVWAGRYRPGFRPGWGGRPLFRGGVAPSAWRGRYRYPAGYRYGMWRGRYPYRPGVPYPIWPGLLPLPPPVEGPPPDSGAPLAPPPPLVAPPIIAAPTAVFDPSLMPPEAQPEPAVEPPAEPSGGDSAAAAPGGDAPAAPEGDAQPDGDAPASEFFFEFGGAFTPTPVENPGGGRIADRRAPHPSQVAQVRGVGRNHVPLHRLAAAALEALITAARADGIREPLLRPTSGFRDPARQAQLWQQALQRYGSPQAARRWVAPPGGSAHQTGRAIDFYLGGQNSSDRVAQLRTLPAYQWLVRNAARFGFYPYANEPWHWEYNPPANGSRR